jgi:CTP:molybdopterin cytidylyltransferase MocA
MGLPKPLLLKDGKPLFQYLTDVLRTGGVEHVIIVTTTELALLIREQMGDYSNVEVVVNLDPGAGMLSSVQVGVDAVADQQTDALLVCPCDLPLLTPDTVYAILHYWIQKEICDRARIVVPLYQGKRGHPTLFSAALFTAIRMLDSHQVGLNTLLKQRAIEVHEVPVDDRGAVQDTDTPEEWRQWLGMNPQVQFARDGDSEEDRMVEYEKFDVPEDVEEALQRQDEAIALLERLRAEEPVARKKSLVGGGRRDFRRWPTPPGVTVEIHNGTRWTDVDCLDMGTGGARVDKLPAWVLGPVPARLKAPGLVSVITLADVMWRDHEGRAGLRFEFLDEEERELWSGALIDALLARHALT